MRATDTSEQANHDGRTGRQWFDYGPDGGEVGVDPSDGRGIIVS